MAEKSAPDHGDKTVNASDPSAENDVSQRGADIEYPQRGPGRPRKPKSERRSDQMSIRMKPSTRARIEQLSHELDESIAEIVERAISQFKS